MFVIVVLFQMDSSEFVLRARGLPWGASAEDVQDFFKGISLINIVVKPHIFMLWTWINTGNTLKQPRFLQCTTTIKLKS